MQKLVIYQIWIIIVGIEHFSIEWPKTKLITLANHKGHRQFGEPVNLKLEATFSGSKVRNFYPESSRISEDDTTIFQVFRRRSEHIPIPVRGRILLNTTSFPMLFLSKLSDFGESIAIYPFYMEFSFLTLVWVYILLESVSFVVVITHIFQLSVRNWFVSVRSKFSTRRRETHAQGMRVGRYKIHVVNNKDGKFFKLGNK